MKSYDELDEIINLLAKERDGNFMLHSHASTLVLLGRRLQERGSVVRPGVILSTSENCSLEDAAFLTEVFRCPISNWYSSREVDNIAQVCKRGSMHINVDQCVVEITDNDGNLLPPGTRGNITLTFFNNYVMPFIRYVNGDCGTIQPEPCPCRRSLPVLTFEGRSVEFILLPDGRTIHSFTLMGLFQRRSTAVVKYQIVRDGPWAFRVRFVPAGNWNENEKKQLLANFKSVLGQEAEINIEIVDTLFEAGQKSVPFVNLSTPPKV